MDLEIQFKVLHKITMTKVMIGFHYFFFCTLVFMVKPVFIQLQGLFKERIIVIHILALLNAEDNRVNSKKK